jgi:hypothetical protein
MHRLARVGPTTARSYCGAGSSLSDAAEAELVGNAIMDLIVEREVCSDPPRVLVPVLADVEVVGCRAACG